MTPLLLKKLFLNNKPQFSLKTNINFTLNLIKLKLTNQSPI